MIKSFVALDLETTGLNPAVDRILEIGAVKIIDGRETEVLSTLVDPGRQVTERITALTGITNEMVAAGMEYSQAVSRLVDFCQDLPILGHNVIFDYSFVKRAAVNQQLTFEMMGVDTLKIARQLLPELPHRTLEYLCKYYGIGEETHHRATEDARSAICLYERLRQEFPESPDGLFEAAPLNYQVKKQSPITPAQKGYLNDLVKYHKIELPVRIDSLTKNEASRIIDQLILEYGRITRQRPETAWKRKRNEEAEK